MATEATGATLDEAARWIDRLERECRKLAGSPGMGRRREELGSKLRSFPVGNYLLFYRDHPDRLEIVRLNRLG